VEHCIFIHTNDKQWLGAQVAKYAIERNSKNNDKFEVRFIHTRDHQFLKEKEGREYLRDGDKRVWLNDDLQSFTPLRFMPPELMNYQGRSMVIDPDVFAVGDVWELLNRDMQGSAMMCRPKSGNKGKRGALATSVMLLDNAKLTHWRCEQRFNELFTFKTDYMDWISLKLEDRDQVGLFETFWNDFDRLDNDTRLLHNTKRKTQPWKSGLKVDYRPADTFRLFPPRHWLRRGRRALFGDYGLAGSYKTHPDIRQQNFFFGLVKECLDKGIINEEIIQDEMKKNNLRHDAFDVIKRTPSLGG
jgi:hypothetical protein